MIKVFWLNWLLVFGAITWFASSVVLLIGYNKMSAFDESYYPGACIVRQNYYIDGNTTAISYFDYQDPSYSFELKQNVTILKNYDPATIQKYMNIYFPIGSYVGCLVSERGLNVQLEDDGSFFVAALSLYIVCALTLALYAILQYIVFRRRMVYKELEDRDPADLTLYQNSIEPVPALDEIKTNFPYAQKMMWHYKDRIDEEKFKELTDLQIRAIVIHENCEEQKKFMREVYKTIKSF